MISRAALVVPIILSLVSAAAAAPLGPDAARCTAGSGPSFLVRVTGLKNRNGTVRVRLFGGSPSTYFDREKALVRTQIATPSSDPIEICIPAPRPGIYAIDVRHDVNGDDKTNMSDGGGSSGNPRPSLFSIITKRKPAPAIVQVEVGQGVQLVPVTMMYVRNGRLQPIGG